MEYIQKPFHAFTPLELYHILRLRQEIFIIEQACIYPDIDSKDEDAQHLLAYENGELVGCLRILKKGVSFDEASIGRVVVAAPHRGRGIAKEMMRRALVFSAEEWGETRVKISAQSYALPLYEDVGFVTMSEEYLEDGIPHVDMVWEM